MVDAEARLNVLAYPSEGRLGQPHVDGESARGYVFGAKLTIRIGRHAPLRPHRVDEISTGLNPKHMVSDIDMCRRLAIDSENASLHSATGDQHDPNFIDGIRKNRHVFAV